MGGLAEAMVRTRKRLIVRGLVQGVGFRPFVYRTAVARGLFGWVANAPSGVVIEVEGPAASLVPFEQALRCEAPGLARVEAVEGEELSPAGYTCFEIRRSQGGGARETLVSPDMATCPDCLHELFDPRDRRFGYPFINCTNCGPRYTIIDALPYDRPATAMGDFPMCPPCAREYEDPCDRRFHAQPDACDACGPSLRFEPGMPGSGGALSPNIGDTGSALIAASDAIHKGQTIAVKGLGGFHLAVDACNDQAVQELRRRKNRPEKPLAVMVENLQEASRYVRLSAEEAGLLASPRAPILLAEPRSDTLLAGGVAPGQPTLGIMLPYTPLQHLLLKEAGGPLVMTSGNLHDEPLAAGNEEARARLGELAGGGFLMHNRDIRHRTDDSVVFIVRGHEMVLRRGRGYAPEPLPFPSGRGDVLALGGHEKGAFCLTRGDKAFLSHHIGELTDCATALFYRESLAHYRSLFQPSVAVIACDRHPGYLTTRLADEMAASCSERPPVMRVQHHHAHVAAVMGENGLTGQVIGVAFDGTGLGDDGTLWGGEFLICSRAGFHRAGSLAPVPLPGGELAIRRPYRTAYGMLAARTDGPAFRALAGKISNEERRAMDFQMAGGINTPLTSSAGRLFDAAATICGFRGSCSYDAQAAVWLEGLARAAPQRVESYPFETTRRQDLWLADGAGILDEMAEDIGRGTPGEVVAARFHETVACLAVEICRLIQSSAGLTRVVLSGGVFQNRRLLEALWSGLLQNGFAVYVPGQCPAGDGGLAYGQAVVAREQWEERKCVSAQPV